MIAASFDGTTGRSRHAGRRTHVIQLLRDAPRALSVREVAAAAGIPTATARYHLEAFVDAGLAERSTAHRNGPGRPEVVYTGTLPNQTHERAQGFRVLAAALTGVLGSTSEGEHTAYRVGRDWASRVLMGPAFSHEGIENDDDIVAAVAAKLDSLWFAPQVLDDAADAAEDDAAGAGRSAAVYMAADAGGDDAAGDGSIRMVINNCPLGAPDGTRCTATCHLEAGFVDGLLDRLGSRDHRVAEIMPQHPEEHSCTLRITRHPCADPPATDENPVAHDGHDLPQLRASAPLRA